jgi:hypothetical protein
VVRAYARGAQELAWHRHRIRLDYTPESIEAVETMMDALYKADHSGSLLRFLHRPSKEQVSQMALLWGTYIGEVIRLHHGGEWVQEPVGGTGEPALTLKIGEIGYFPTDKAYRRLTNGEDDNVWLYYRELAEKLPKLPEEEEEE